MACKRMPGAVRAPAFSITSLGKVLISTSNSTANYLVMTDCAFLFFRGVPLRIWDPEINCDLPCLEDVFDVVHPFTHPNFAFKREMSARQAFHRLFEAQALHHSFESATMLDSFMLIHSEFIWQFPILTLLY